MNSERYNIVLKYILSNYSEKSIQVRNSPGLSCYDKDIRTSDAPSAPPPNALPSLRWRTSFKRWTTSSRRSRRRRRIWKTPSCAASRSGTAQRGSSGDLVVKERGTVDQVAPFRKQNFQILSLSPSTILHSEKTKCNTSAFASQMEQGCTDAEWEPGERGGRRADCQRRRGLPRTLQPEIQTSRSSVWEYFIFSMHWSLISTDENFICYLGRLALRSAWTSVWL